MADDQGHGAQTWITIAEAAASTGMSRSTLRSWYRAGRLPSRMEDGPHGPQRMVPVDALVDLARPGDRLARAFADGLLGPDLHPPAMTDDLGAQALEVIEAALHRAEQRAERAEAALLAATARASRAEAALEALRR